MYIRFVSTDDENGFWATGIITVAKDLKEEGKLYDYEVPLLEGIFEWLNDNMPCPPFEKNLKSGDWTDDAVAWFKDTAQQFVNKFWEVMAILKEHDVPTRVIKTEKSG